MNGEQYTTFKIKNEVMEESIKVRAMTTEELVDAA